MLQSASDVVPDLDDEPEYELSTLRELDFESGAFHGLYHSSVHSSGWGLFSMGISIDFGCATGAFKRSLPRDRRALPKFKEIQVDQHEGG